MLYKEKEKWSQTSQPLTFNGGEYVQRIGRSRWLSNVCNKQEIHSLDCSGDERSSSTERNKFKWQIDCEVKDSRDEGGSDDDNDGWKNVK